MSAASSYTTLTFLSRAINDSVTVAGNIKS